MDKGIFFPIIHQKGVCRTLDIHKFPFDTLCVTYVNVCLTNDESL